jgi:pilus assembly protein CpaE
MQPETTNQSALVLLITDDAGSIEPIRQALDHRKDSFRLQCVSNVPTGAARIAGGGVSLVLLDLALSRAEGENGLSHLHKLYAEAPSTPIVVLCLAEQETVALGAVRAGAADYMIKERCAMDLDRLVQSVVERYRRPPESEPMEAAVTPKTATMIALLGAKGGVGTTTVALNVGASLARKNKAIVAELRPTFGTLSQYFGPQCRTRNVTHLLNMEPAAIAEAQTASCLWPYGAVPGLSFLFGPQAMEYCQELGLARAKAIFTALTGLADYVVVDLAATLSDTNRAVIQDSNLLALVVDKDPICIQSAKLMLQTIQSWNATPRIGAVIVSREALSSSMLVSEIEAQLGLPIFGVIPPASDLCLAAQNARTPLVVFQAESLAAGSITALAERLANPVQTR